MTTPANTPGICPLNSADHPLTLDSAFALPPSMKQTATALLRPAKLTREKKGPLTPQTFFADRITDEHLSLWLQITSSSDAPRHSENTLASLASLASGKSSSSKKSARLMRGADRTDAGETLPARSSRG